jgi:hypothetical protein
VSFVGRPFSLEQADEHFARLKRWGFTFLRLLVTWEAIEHAGPGMYDQAYLEYVHAIVRKAGEHGMRLFIDPHEDVWSRFTGGDGAPGWTFECAELDLAKFSETGAAIVHQIHGDPFPRMIWPTNNAKLAAATMWTLFFAGNDFAPRVRVDGEPIQEYLQRHYVGAVQALAHRLRRLEAVVGYDTMNEPSAGYVGWRDLESPPDLLRLGPMPTPLQAMALGAGIPQQVDAWEMGILGPKRVGSQRLNPAGARCWLAGRECIWREHGVWDVDSQGRARLLQPKYFVEVAGRQVSFPDDHLVPFARRFAAAIQQVDGRTLIFLEHDPVGGCPAWRAHGQAQIVYAPHWYDGYVLFLKEYRRSLAVEMRTGRLILGKRRIRESFAGQLRVFLDEAAQRLGDVPVLLGEFGIPFDMKRGRSYRTGDFGPQVEALDRSFRAVEDNLLSCTLWNYTADNTNAHGDQWNGEDLSIFSRDQQSDPDNIDSGGRALQAAVRPYPMAIAGEPLRMSFDRRQGVFELEFRHDPQVDAPTEIFLPEVQFPHGARWMMSDGQIKPTGDGQVFHYRHTSDRLTHTIAARRL